MQHDHSQRFWWRMKTLLLQLREAARAERDHLVKFKLRETADDLSRAIRVFADSPTEDALKTVNGLWAKGNRLLWQLTSTPTPSGNGAGLKEGAQLAASA